MLISEVSFSSLLPTKFPQVHQQLMSIFKKYNIQMHFLEHTKDVWCRDYMPVQASDGSYVQFQYRPDYLLGYEHLQSDPNQINKKHEIEPYYSNIIMDGGNLVKCGNKAIVTDKIFLENPEYLKADLVDEIKTLLQLDELIVIPRQPYEMTGHNDGMVRFIDDNTILLNDFSRESKSFNNKLEKTLRQYGLEIECLRYPASFYTLQRDWGAYINFLQVDDLIIVPTFSIAEDVEVMSRFKEIFPRHKLVSIAVPELIAKGGALNCISWEKAQLEMSFK